MTHHVIGNHMKLYVSPNDLGCHISYYIEKNTACCIVATKKPSLIEALLTINKMALPTELIDIIKDYVFCDKETMIHRAIYNRMVFDSVQTMMHAYPRTRRNYAGHYRTTVYVKRNRLFSGRHIDMVGHVCNECGAVHKYNGCRICHPQEYALEEERADWLDLEYDLGEDDSVITNTEMIDDDANEYDYDSDPNEREPWNMYSDEDRGNRYYCGRYYCD